MPSWLRHGQSHSPHDEGGQSSGGHMRASQNSTPSTSQDTSNDSTLYEPHPGSLGATPGRAATPQLPAPTKSIATLRVQVVGARNLTGKDRNGKSDPFIILNLPGAPPLGSASRDRNFYRRQTPVQPKTLDPSWKAEEATFEWTITSDWFKGTTLEVHGIDPHANSPERENITSLPSDGVASRKITSSPVASIHVSTPTGEPSQKEKEISPAPRRVLASRPSNVRKLSAVTGRMLIAPVRMTTKGAVATTRAVRRRGRPRPIRLRKGLASLKGSAGSGALDDVTNPVVSAIEFVCWDKDKWSGNDYLGEASFAVSEWIVEGKSADWNAGETIAIPLKSSRRNAKVSGEILVKIGLLSLQPDQSVDDIYVALLDANAQMGETAVRAVPADQSVGTAGPSEAFIDDGLSSDSESEAQEELLSEDDDDAQSATSDEGESTMTDDTDDNIYDSDQGLGPFSHLRTPRATLPVTIAPSAAGAEEDVSTEPEAAPTSAPARRKRQLIPNRLRRTRSSLPQEAAVEKLGTDGTTTPASGATSDVGDVKQDSNRRSGRRLRVRPPRSRKQTSGDSSQSTGNRMTRKERRRIQREARERRQDFAFRAAQGKDIIGIVQLEVKGAEDLPRWRNSLGTSFDMDPFVIVSFGQRIFRTRVARHTLNPTWDEKLLFHVRRHEANYVTKLVVYDWDKLSSNDYVCESGIKISDLIDEAPKPDPNTGLYKADEDAMHDMKAFTLDLNRNEDGSGRQLGSHRPKLRVSARYTPYAALRHRFWRQILIQYDSNDSGTLSILELVSMLDSLGSTLTRQTIDGFFARFNKNADAGDELEIDEAIIALEGEIVKPFSEKRMTRGEALTGLDLLHGATPLASGLQTPSIDVGQSDSMGDQLELTSSNDFAGPTAASIKSAEAESAAAILPSATVEGVTSKGVFSRPVGHPEITSKQSLGSSSTSTSASTNISADAAHKLVTAERPPVSRSSTVNTQDSLIDADHGDGQVERLIKLKSCPMCRMPRLSKKAEVDIVTHLAVCASQDWRRVDSMMVGNYVTAMQAHRKWVTRALSKISQGQYQLGANSANIIVQDRMTGEMLEEKMQVYVRLGIRLLYKGARSRMEGARIRRMLKNMSVKQGVKFDSPASAREIPHFIAFHSLKVDEILDPIESFKTFNEFFYRKLKPDARPIADKDDPRTLVSVADCRLMCFSSVSNATQLWIKGRGFTVEKLLADGFVGEASGEQLGEYTHGGGLCIFRLAPQDYHRFHCPADATVGKITMIDGQYYTVNPMAIRSAIDVYCENVRAIVPFHSEQFGTFYAVCIGAMMVGSIRLTVEEGDKVQRGQEMGYFAFGGSTIVVVFPEGRVDFDEDLLANSEKAIETLVRVGMRIGRQGS